MCSLSRASCPSSPRSFPATSGVRGRKAMVVLTDGEDNASRNTYERVFGEPIPAVGVPLYADARLYGERGIPIVMYGAGPRTILEANAKRADENLLLDDLRRATKVVAATLAELLAPD